VTSTCPPCTQLPFRFLRGGAIPARIASAPAATTKGPRAYRNASSTRRGASDREWW
jgi:hypothetical protein